MPRLNPSAHNKAHLLLTLVLLCLTGSLYQPLQLWILVLVLCSVAIRLSLYMNWQKHQISLRTLNLLAILSAIALAYFGWQLGLLLGMLNLLVMASSLKLMLLGSRRDYFQLVGVQFFLLGTGLVFQQNIAFSLFYAVLALMLLLSLAFHISPSTRFVTQLKRVGKLCLQALPLSLLLFLVIPKLGPLWQMPNAGSSKSGLSEKVTPGDIANLARSADLAFRATFSGAVPKEGQRYWRALVLEEFDGRSWQVHPYRSKFRERMQSSRFSFAPPVAGPTFDYQIIAQPTQQKWLYGLDIARSDAPLVYHSHDYQLISQIPLQSTFSYQVRSYYNTPLVAAYPGIDDNINLQVPKNGNPRTREWAAKLLQEHPDPKDYIAAIESYFTSNGFRYTLRPNPMPVDPVDQFLFDDRAGFCSHYASAMTYLLRLGGIPARMVTGYLGGEMRGEAYMSVHQYDAHAWVEWLSDTGWQRLDPTVLVSPMRLDFGLEQAVAYENSFLADAPFNLAALKNIAWLNQVRLLLADMDYYWSRMVLGFDRQNQQALLRSILGQLTPGRLALFGLAVVALIALLLGLYQLKQWLPHRHAPATRYYQKALTMLAAQGIERPEWQGPQDFSEVATAQLSPQAAVYFKQLSALYSSHQYRPASAQAQKQSLQKMRLLLKRLKKALRTAPSFRQQP
ncbi:DUF3488 and transglutaminase-like domain-containing protein [Aliiglaciecola sp. CAU 1673]|uniref:transglutaminase TgpA family protein n=1 Tax=Aliiglaciecola sp. CAU 1673 TaxID=3032595 RepID=UPI0023D99B28|nr:DUF3488 and transglutaminase-like domain-containing protein [Aliiglaciecola sp. CAU 1673]MDF2179403.1 DUF3488 and transglutaminase-like domain-containing protein [Aliiglaciecola sp. CAU 1673]